MYYCITKFQIFSFGHHQNYWNSRNFSQITLKFWTLLIFTVSLIGANNYRTITSERTTTGRHRTPRCLWSGKGPEFGGTCKGILALHIKPWWYKKKFISHANACHLSKELRSSVVSKDALLGSLSYKNDLHYLLIFTYKLSTCHTTLNATLST